MTGVWRNSMEAHRERLRERLARPPAPPRAPVAPRPGVDSDHRHCLAIVRANAGRGFPQITIAGGRDERGANNPGSVAA